ncbi:hypothetical protein HPB52_012640 [Rhipicephalus sanguineus]|uniref:Uncharacterized protein n=1 Tax=Rhipicephalus sanguineus TaxID=34632 RepID=A0A9D4STZ5_RHISA|nr:hypothetical protein HPB52_012640 [Rhipicephalus sanguineus]
MSATVEGYTVTLCQKDRERCEEKTRLCVLDPFTLHANDCVSDVDFWPRTDISYIHEFLVLRTTFITGEQLKSRKALEGHNTVTSGWVPWAAAGRAITFGAKNKSTPRIKAKKTSPLTKSPASTSVQQTASSEVAATGAGRAVTFAPEKKVTSRIKTRKTSQQTKSPTSISVRQTTSSEEMETEESTDPTSSRTPSTSRKRRAKMTHTSPEPTTTRTSHPKRTTPGKAQVPSTLAPATLKPSPRAKPPLIVCVMGGQLRSTVPPPDGLCTFVIFEHVRVAKKSDDFVASSNQEAFDNFLKMAAGNKVEQFLLSLTSDLEYDESLEVGDRAEAIMRRYHDQNVRGYGFAHHRVVSTGIDSGKLWKHHSMLSNLRQWSKYPLVLFIGLEIYHHRSYSDVYVTGLVAEAAV